MEASQHSLLAACFTSHSINATLAIVPQRGAGLWNFKSPSLHIPSSTSWIPTTTVSKIYIIKERDSKKLEPAQMRFLTPLLGLTRLDRQGNPNIRKKLEVKSLIEGIKGVC
jgi:hypothetical protein